MLTQQLQDADVLPYAAPGTMSLFQPHPEFPEHRRQLPVAVHVRVIQGGRSAAERHQVMQRIENLVAGVVAAPMRRHNLIPVNDLDAVNVAFDRHGLERDGARDAVAHLVEPHELVLVDFRRPANAGVKTPPRQNRGLLPLMRESLANCALRIAGGTGQIVPAALPEVRVQLGQILDARHGSRPATL